MTAASIFERFEKTLKEKFPKERKVKATLIECYVPELDDGEKWNNVLKDFKYRDDVKFSYDPEEKYMMGFENNSVRSKQYNFIIFNLNKPIFYTLFITTGLIDESRTYLNPLFTSGGQSILNLLWKMYPDYTDDELKIVEKNLNPKYNIIVGNIDLEELLVDEISVYDIFTKEPGTKEMDEEKRIKESVEWINVDDIDSLVIFAFISYNRLYNKDTTQQSLMYESALLTEYINELSYKNETPRDLRKKEIFYTIALNIFFERASYRDMFERNSDVENPDSFLATLDCTFTDAFCLATSRILDSDILDERKNKSNIWNNCGNDTVN